MITTCSRSISQALGAALLAIFLSSSLPSTLAAQTAQRAEAESTRLMVRVRANDAKLLQDPVGGARVTIRNAETGAVLDRGTVTGGSGSTEQIMRQPHRRGEDIYSTPDAAGYEATLMLEQPTRIEITAEGPLDYPQAMQSASKTIWMVPGQDVLGDGVVLTVHGFIVEMLQPMQASVTPGDALTVRTRVRMLCGCPTEPGGLWDSSRYTLKAQLLREGRVVAEAPMSFTGTTNEFEGTVTVPEQGATAVRALVMDADRVNFGVATKELAASR